MLDRHDLYELCVQSPGDLVPLLVAVHGGSPRVLGEDFCGTAATSRAWTGRIDGGRAVAVDHDGAVLARMPTSAGIEIVHGDVRRDTTPDRHSVDVLFTGNFSIGEWPDRRELLAYLRHARSRLNGGGIFVCDTYGGETAFVTGTVDREQPAPGGRIVRYTWEQRRADPLTGEVVNAMHFQVRAADGRLEQEIRDAFVYRWRLWSVPELREALRESGFARAEVYRKVPEAIDDEGAAYVQPIEDAGLLDDTFDVLVVGRESDQATKRPSD